MQLKWHTYLLIIAIFINIVFMQVIWTNQQIQLIPTIYAEAQPKVEIVKGSEELENKSNQSTTKKKYFGEVKVSYYCVEDYPHICNNGNLITASGTMVTAFRTLAVDPSIIPLGTHVLLEVNGEEYYLVAEDTGGNIKQNRVDMAVTTHQLALQMGIDYGTLYILDEKSVQPISFYIEQTER